MLEALLFSCYGTCKYEIMSGPNRGECGGGKCHCPTDYCVSCGGLTENDESMCETCKELIEDFNILEET